MDDPHILAEIERRLTRGDPELATLLDSLNQQLVEDSQDVVRNRRSRRDRRWLTAFVLVVAIAVILIAMFSTPPRADGDKGRLDGHADSVGSCVASQKVSPDSCARTHDI
ncbi:DUF3040 domain-containing protein [Streptomyces achmelvichensis]|uniref:DUF3040 domain-containing protein n=1 Tax=Streptomyces achmelvichensis TaxID=3134111 RepID=UPI003C12B9BB